MAASLAHKTTFILDARRRVTAVIDGKGALVRQNVWGDDDLLVGLGYRKRGKESMEKLREEGEKSAWGAARVGRGR